jgi:RNase P protein component
MLPKSKRLSRVDFATLPVRSALVHGNLFSLNVFPHTRLPSAGPHKAVLCAPSKFAVVISAKTIKRSVDRHLIKRRAMEAIHKTALCASGFYCIFYAKSPACTASFAEIQADITALLRNARVLQ